MSIACLFVDADGIYPALVGKENCWGVNRDARLYPGTGSVVAHPPCQRWGALGAANFARWGGEHNRPGNDAGCFESALGSVRKWGGVLEHPAKSMAFARFGLCKPAAHGWTRSGKDEWVCEVWQSAYGHRASKATWLFYKGSREPKQAIWSRTPGTCQVGYQDKRGKSRNKPTLSSKEASATPRLFAEYLIELAANSTGS